MFCTHLRVMWLAKAVRCAPLNIVVHSPTLFRALHYLIITHAYTHVLAYRRSSFDQIKSIFTRALYSFLWQTIKSFWTFELIAVSHSMLFIFILQFPIPFRLKCQAIWLLSLASTRNILLSYLFVPCERAWRRCSKPLHARSVQEAKVLTAHPLPFILVPCDWSVLLPFCCMFFFFFFFAFMCVCLCAEI